MRWAKAKTAASSRLEGDQTMMFVVLRASEMKREAEWKRGTILLHPLLTVNENWRRLRMAACSALPSLLPLMRMTARQVWSELREGYP